MSKIIVNSATKFTKSVFAKSKDKIFSSNSFKFMVAPKQQYYMKASHDAFVPEIVFKCNPFNYYLSKLKMWKLKWTWDCDFDEAKFVEQSKLMATTLTDSLRLRDTQKIIEFSTSNLYNQMANESIDFPQRSCMELLCFRTEDLQQAIPMKVQLYKIFGLKYAIIDVVMVGLRQVGNGDTAAELDIMKKALFKMDPDLVKQLSENNSQLPFIFIELFLRFRRNYSNVATENILIKDTNRWLVSVYKICKFNIVSLPT